MIRKLFSLPLFLILLSAGITFFVFRPVLQYDFVTWDDRRHLSENVSVRHLNPVGIKEIFSKTISDTYVPLTILSFAIEYHFFKLDPFIYHLNNLLLHIACVVLIFLLVRQWGGSLGVGFFASLLFGIHPIHVESVAWITERKDVLYSLFYLLALYQYGQFLIKGEKTGYFWALGFGCLSMLAKPMALSLPLILLLMDWYKDNRDVKISLLNKIPFFLYIVPLAWLTYRLHMRNPIEDVGHGILIWIWSATFYIKSFFWPNNLLPLYTLPKPISFFHPSYLSSCLLFHVLVLCVITLPRLRLFKFAVGYYFLSAFFLFRFDEGQDLTIVADRFMYLPSVGIIILLGVGFERLMKWARYNGKYLGKCVGGMGVFVFLILGCTSSQQTAVWKDSPHFWARILEHHRDNDAITAMAHNGRGLYFMDENRLEDALRDFNQAVLLNSRFFEAFNNRASLYMKRNQDALAIQDLKTVIYINPQYSKAYNNRGYLLYKQKNYEESLKDYSKSIAIDANAYETYFNRALVYTALNRVDDAINDFSFCIQNNPGFAQAYLKRSLLYFKIRSFKKALNDAIKAKSLGIKKLEKYINQIEQVSS